MTLTNPGSLRKKSGLKEPNKHINPHMLVIRCIGKSTSGKKYQVEYGTFSLGKSTILVLFPIGTFSYIIGKSTIIFQ